MLFMVYIKEIKYKCRKIGITSQHLNSSTLQLYSTAVVYCCVEVEFNHIRNATAGIICIVYDKIINKIGIIL